MFGRPSSQAETGTLAWPGFLGSLAGIDLHSHTAAQMHPSCNTFFVFFSAAVFVGWCKGKSKRNILCWCLPLDTHICASSSLEFCFGLRAPACHLGLWGVVGSWPWEDADTF